MADFTDVVAKLNADPIAIELRRVWREEVHPRKARIAALEALLDDVTEELVGARGHMGDYLWEKYGLDDLVARARAATKENTDG